MVINLAEGQQAFTSNAYLVTGDRPVLVDSGSNFDVVESIREHVPTIEAIILTHTHPDHVGNLADAKAAFGVNAIGFDPRSGGGRPGCGRRGDGSDR